MAKFAAILRFGDQAKRQEARPRHRAYLEGLLAEGKLYESGPWADDSGALIIYEAADEAEARGLLAADPYTEAGALAATEIKEWTLLYKAQG